MVSRKADTAMVRGVTSALSLAMLPTALGAIVGAVLTTPGVTDSWLWLHALCQPLTTTLALVLAWSVKLPVSVSYRRFMILGLLACLPGDILLALPGNLFLPGLLCFLVAHVFFIVAFTRGRHQVFLLHPWPLLLFLGLGAFLAWRFWPTLPSLQRVPLLSYMAVLAIMASQAIRRVWALAEANDPIAASARWAALGGLLFLLSDAVLGWSRFVGGLPWPSLLQLAMYYPAIWLLARSVDQGPCLLPR